MRFRLAELFGSRNDGHRAALLVALDGELDGTVLEREQGVILAAADVFARVELGAALADEDAAGGDDLAAVGLDAEVLGVAVPPVSR